MILRRSAAIAIATVAVLVPVDGRSDRGAAVDTPARVTSPGVLWLAPEPDQISARTVLANAVASYSAGRLLETIPTFEKAANDPVLGGYALLYLGHIQLSLNGNRDALATARRIQALNPEGYLKEASLVLLADAAAEAGEPAAAFNALQQLAAKPGTQPIQAIELKRGRAALAVNEKPTAIRALSRVFFEFPATPEGAEAQLVLNGASPGSTKPTRDTSAAFIARAERLFAGRQYADARSAFEALKPVVAGDDLDLATLRVAACDYHLKKFTSSMNALAGRAKAIGAASSSSPAILARAPETEYFILGNMRELGDKDYEKRLRAYIDRDQDQVFSERALMDLAQFHNLANDDATAAKYFAESYRRFPQGALAERAAWKAGWWAYRTGDYAATIRIFDSAAAGMRRADSRPAWLYWSAKARANQSQTDLALVAYARAISDYRNTYYGRLAVRDMEAIQAALRPAGAGPVSPASRDMPATVVGGAKPGNSSLIEALLAAGMYDEAIGELRLIQVESGTSPLIEATIAMALNRDGRLRPGITAMRRAYPQFLAAGGEALPSEILTVIFPVDHWEEISAHAREKKIDRYLLAALIAQESTFQADVKSSAGAWGLMQIMPPTGRQYAQRLGIRPFATRRLIEPDVNLSIGTTYFAELLERFNDPAPALAAYNAGPSRAAKWLAERPGLPREEFIDDIPYPETQNYVKRILGTADDYRRLYR